MSHHASGPSKILVDAGGPEATLMRLKELARKLLHKPGVTVFGAAGIAVSPTRVIHEIFRRVVGVTPTAYRAASEFRTRVVRPLDSLSR